VDNSRDTGVPSGHREQIHGVSGTPPSGYREQTFGVSGTAGLRILLIFRRNFTFPNSLTSLTQIFNLSNSPPFLITRRTGGLGEVWKLKAIEAFRFLWKGFLKPALPNHPSTEEKQNCQAILSVTFAYAERSVRKRTVIAHSEDYLLGNKRAGQTRRQTAGIGTRKKSMLVLLGHKRTRGHNPQKAGVS
jgi:hypothetical protein